MGVTMDKWVSADGLSALASAVALVAAFWSVRMVGKQRVDSAVDTLDTLHVVVTQAYLDHPELRAVFNEGENGIQPRELDRQTQLRAAAIAETLCDAMERALAGRDKRMPEVTDGLMPWIEDSFRKSGFLRTWLRSRRGWYGDALFGVLEHIESERGCGPITAQPNRSAQNPRSVK